MEAAGQFAGISDSAQILSTASLRVIADHIDLCVLIADGVDLATTGHPTYCGELYGEV